MQKPVGGTVFGRKRVVLVPGRQPKALVIDRCLLGTVPGCVVDFISVLLDMTARAGRISGGGMLFTVLLSFSITYNGKQNG